MKSWFRSLLGLFGGDDDAAKPAPDSKARTAPPRSTATKATASTAPVPKAKPKPKERAKREMEYMLVVGLDFGTAYTKCVVRDAMVENPGRAFPVVFNLHAGGSLLFPSVVYRSNGSLSTALAPVPAGAERIDYLKMRMVASAGGDRANPWQDYRLPWSPQIVVSWFLATVLAEAGKYMRQHWPDFGEHPNDHCFVNLCVPIAHTDGSPVESRLLEALYAAWIAVGPLGTEPPSIDKIAGLLAAPNDLRHAADFCYSYPETSANLQAFLKSRSRKPGLYLLLDVGAGTVDLSFFQLLEDPQSETPLRYYHASVLDAGSSRLEIKALQLDSSLSIDDVIAHKEGRSRKPNSRVEDAFARACDHLFTEVARGIGTGVTVTESKLHPDPCYQRKQMHQVRLMFSGGGFIPNPFERGARWFQEARQWAQRAPIEPIPHPPDLEFSKAVPKVAFSRLAVAYGLSFPRVNLEGHKFPSQITTNRSGPRREKREIVAAPTMDEV